ncbi:MAG: type II toxin-antitoxin system VapC family toxin [Bryobacteraceae bacterium]
MILLDVSLLLYAHNTGAKEHERAVLWLRDVFSGAETVAFSWETILGFLRLATTPKLFARPLEFEEAVEMVEAWLGRDNVVTVGPQHRHWQILRGLLPKSRPRGSLVMDAHLAALAIEHGATLCTNDRDFLRFPGLKVEFPLQ